MKFTPPQPWIINGNSARLPLADQSIHACVCSPPYYGLRAYGTHPQVWGGDAACAHEWGSMEPARKPGQVEQTKWKNASGAGEGQTTACGQFCQKCGAWLGEYGNEPTPELYVEHTVEIFREVKRVLRDDGSLWLNIGDSYNAYNGNRGKGKSTLDGRANCGMPALPTGYGLAAKNLKNKDLIGIPWMMAFALRADGWYLRQDIIWSKRSPMPESVRDRCTKSHEYVFLLTKSDRYYFDQEAIKEKAVGAGSSRESVKRGGFAGKNTLPGKEAFRAVTETRNRRSVWTLSTTPCKDAHFATFPLKLPELCIMAGTSERGCCPNCGAQWRRVVDRVRVPTRPGIDTKCLAHSDGDTATADLKGWNRPNVIGNRDPQRHVSQSVTTHWTPTCNCPAHDPIPCTVLDNFNGAGTTGVACKFLGRRYVGVELNPAYIEITRRRIASAVPAKEKKARKKAVPEHVQPSLFPIGGAL